MMEGDGEGGGEEGKRGGTTRMWEGEGQEGEDVGFGNVGHLRLELFSP